jgi:quercetin dioxygenase-like cupin family protein
MPGGYTIKHRDEFESMAGSGETTWMLARKALDTSAFGFNLVEIAPGGGIPEHTEAESGQVELYAILEGEAVLRIEGEDHPAPAGTFASIEPHDPQPLRRSRHRDADRRSARGRLRADVLGLSGSRLSGPPVDAEKDAYCA